MKNLTKIITILILLFSLNPSTLAVDETPKFTIKSYEFGAGPIEYQLPPGATLKEEILSIENFDSDREIKVNIDFLGSQKEGEYKPIPKEWFIPSMNTVTVPELTGQPFTYKFSVPKDTENGDYRGTIMAQLLEFDGSEEGTNGGVKIVLAVGVKIKLTVDSSLPLTEDLMEESMNNENASSVNNIKNQATNTYQNLTQNRKYVMAGAIALSIILLIVLFYVRKKRKQ